MKSGDLKGFQRKVLITTSSFAETDGSVWEVLKANNIRVIVNPYKRTLKESELIRLLEKNKPEGMLAGMEPITAKVIKGSKLII